MYLYELRFWRQGVIGNYPIVDDYSTMEYGDTPSHAVIKSIEKDKIVRDIRPFFYSAKAIPKGDKK